MDRAELEQLDRESLVSRAQAAGIRRARLLTRPELVDELLRIDPALDASQLKRTRGFFGRARDLLSKVVERGLHLPDAADRLRAALTTPLPQVPRPEPRAVPTVTLAEIYAAQGHKERAVDTLRLVLEREPENGGARALLDRLEAVDYVAPEPPLPPEPEVEAAPTTDLDVEEHAREAEAEAEAADDAEAEEADDAEELAATPDEAEVAVEPPPAPDTHSTQPPTFDEVPAVTLRSNECVGIPLAEGRSFVWWRVSAATVRELREAMPAGGFCVRVVVIVPHQDGPHVTTRDFPVSADAGELVVQKRPRGAIIRCAVGWLENATFVPVAHSPAIEAGPRGLLEWTLEGGVHPLASGDPRTSLVARAAAIATTRKGSLQVTL